MVKAAFNKNSWTDLVKKGELLKKVKEERNFSYTIKRMKVNCIGYILHRNCLLKQVIEAKIEGNIQRAERRGRRYKQLLDDFKESGRSWKLKEEVVVHTLWRTRFGTGYGAVVRWTT